MTPILAYHSIGETIPPGFAPWVVHPRQFREQLAGLAKTGRVTVTVSDLVRRRRAGQAPQHAAVLSFDDGFADFLRHALPVLREFGMTATLYVTTGTVGGSFRSLPVLTWRDLAEIRDADIEIGAHTVSHPALDRMPPKQMQIEVRECKHQLEDRLGVAVESFAYPFGYYTRETRHAVIDAGYTSACAVGYSVSRLDDDPFALRRIIVAPKNKRVDRPPATALPYRFRSALWAQTRQSLTKWIGYAG